MDARKISIRTKKSQTFDFAEQFGVETKLRCGLKGRIILTQMTQFLQMRCMHQHLHERCTEES